MGSSLDELTPRTGGRGPCWHHGTARRHGGSPTPEGAPVAEAFWRYFSISGLGTRFHPHAARSSRSAGPGRAGRRRIRLAVIYLNGLGDQAADFLIGLLRQFVGAYQSDPEIAFVRDYDLRSVFGYLNDHADPGHSTEVAQLEWSFLPVLGFEPPVAQLYEALTSDPEFFVSVMEITWRASDAEPDKEDKQDDDAAPEDEPLTDEQVQRAENGYMLLTSIDRLPGTGPDGQLDPEALRTWVNQVLQRAAASGRRKIAEVLIGQILASAPADDDETWPCQASTRPA